MENWVKLLKSGEDESVLSTRRCPARGRARAGQETHNTEKTIERDDDLGYYLGKNK
jgi:hypothetical protein